MSGSEWPGVTEETLRSISTPDRVESRLGPLRFRDGAPSAATAELLYNHLDSDGRETNWLQTIPGNGWFTILRLYNPLQPFFDKTWRPSEIEPA